MPNPQFEFVPPEIIQVLATSAKPYTLLLYYKGENYDMPDARRIQQADHLPYLFNLRNAGKLLLTMPIIDDSNPDLRAIGIFASADKAEVLQMVDNDPVVIHKILRYQILTAMGMKGDTLI